MRTHWFKQLHISHKLFLGTGLIAALGFGVNYLILARGDCGVVRFYEYTFGILGLLVWGCGNLVALFLLIKMERNNLAYNSGTVLLAVINSLMICLLSYLIYSFMDHNFVFSRTGRLIERVEKEDDRQAVLELGRRNVKDSIPLLCSITLDPDKDINLRLNASYALRQIESQVPRDSGHYEESFACLLRLLTDKQNHLRSSAAETLGMIRDTRAVPPLLQALAKEDDEYVAIYMVRALGLLGDNRAFQPLSVLLSEKEKTYYLHSAIKDALEKIKVSEKGGSGD